MVEGDDPPLCLGHDLLGDDKHIAVAQHLGTLLRAEHSGEMCGQVIAWCDLAEPAHRHDADAWCLLKHRAPPWPRTGSPTRCS